MSASLTLAQPSDAPKVLALVARFHDEAAFDTDDAHRAAAIAPLLEGSPYGAVYIVGPRLAPIGYGVITFGWSVEFGGKDAFVDELFLRPSVRGRGIGRDLLQALSVTLAEAGVRAIHLEVEHDNEAALKLYARAGFVARKTYGLMSRRLP